MNGRGAFLCFNVCRLPCSGLMVKRPGLRCFYGVAGAKKRIPRPSPFRRYCQNSRRVFSRLAKDRAGGISGGYPSGSRARITLPVVFAIHRKSAGRYFWQSRLLCVRCGRGFNVRHGRRTVASRLCALLASALRGRDARRRRIRHGKPFLTLLYGSLL